MPSIVFVIVNTVVLALTVLDTALLLRVIHSLFMVLTGNFGEETRLGNFLTGLTEPIILPMRALCARLHIFEDMPLDMPFVMTAMLLSLLLRILPVI